MGLAKFLQPTEAPTIIVLTMVFQFKCFTALPGATRSKMIQCARSTLTVSQEIGVYN